MNAMQQFSELSHFNAVKAVADLNHCTIREARRLDHETAYCLLFYNAATINAQKQLNQK